MFVHKFSHIIHIFFYDYPNVVLMIMLTNLLPFNEFLIVRIVFTVFGVIIFVVMMLSPMMLWLVFVILLFIIIYLMFYVSNFLPFL